MDLGERIRSGVKWLVIGNTGQRALEFIFGVILARLLVPADFGMIVTVQIFTGIAGMLTSGGMGQALVQAKEAGDKDYHAVFTLQLAIGLAIFSGFYFVAPWLATFFENPLYTDLMRVSAIMFLLRPFAYTHSAWLNREMQFKSRTRITIICGIFSGVASVILALFGMGVWSLMLSGVAGGLLRNILLARATPLRLRFNPDIGIMRKHGSYGSKIIANDLVSHLRREGLKLMLSKLAGPAFLGLFNKADSLHRLPYWVFAQPVAQPVFSAMSKIQDDLDQTRYMYYRVITLLGVYILPFYVVMRWVAEPFIEVVYGYKWVEAGEPLSILALTGFFYIVARPSGVLLMAQNRLVQELVVQGIILCFTLGVCYYGLQWGLIGVSWGFLISQIFAAVCLYALVYQTIPTKLTDLAKALLPGLGLNGILLGALAGIDHLSGDMKSSSPLGYLLLLSGSAALIYPAAFLLLPIPALDSETTRWKKSIGGIWRRVTA